MEYMEDDAVDERKPWWRPLGGSTGPHERETIVFLSAREKQLSDLAQRLVGEGYSPQEIMGVLERERNA